MSSMSLMYRRVPLGHIMSFWTACLNLNQVSPCDKTPSKWPCIYIVPEISALCFRGICSCSLPPASVQWRCSCWAVSAWCSPCSAGSWCLLGVHTTLSLHISLSKPLFEMSTQPTPQQLFHNNMINATQSNLERLMQQQTNATIKQTPPLKLQ